MRVVLVSDAWEPQVNGVVRTLQATASELERAGHAVALLTPRTFVTVPCPRYTDIRLSLLPQRGVTQFLARELAGGQAVAIHLATEGPLGLAARRYCLRAGLPFTTAYHTRFPQYLQAMYGLRPAWTWRFLRWFHAPAAAVLAPTATVEAELHAAGIDHLARWTRGVDTDTFAPALAASDLPRPVFLYVGRVAVEKNVEAFLRLDLPGSKLVVGDGPALPRLRARFPEAHFTGALAHALLPELYSAADVFVFPSRTDTYGLVLLEALACGLPVAAFPVQGPRDVLGSAPVGVLDDDLRVAALRALRIDRAACRRFALDHSWREATRQFIDAQRPIAGPLPRASLTTAVL